MYKITEEIKNIYITLERQFDYVNSLSSEIKSSLKNYTVHSFEYLNKRLRQTISLSDEQKELVKNIDKAFNTVPLLDKPITVYRGIAEDYIPSLSSYVSTSYVKEKAIFFSAMKCCLLVITIPSGSKILPLEDISESRSEKEILLPREGNFVITNITYERENDPTSRKYYHITYIPKIAEIFETKKDVKIIEKKVDVNDWVERLVNIIDPEELELFSAEEAVLNLVQTTFKKEDIPKEAIKLAIARLKNTE